MNKNKKKWLILLLFCVVVAASCGVVLLIDGQNRKQQQIDLEELAQQTIVVESNDTTTEECETEEVISRIPEKMIDWDALHEQNEDIYAWIYVPDTTVDYPILQHPTDDEYYLNYNIDGSKGFPGCIYTEASYNSRDFLDRQTLIYGHNLKDKTMFTSLHNFEDQVFFYEGDHFFYIYTEQGNYEYQIFAAYEFPSIHLMDNYDYENDYVYEDYLAAIYEVNGRVANVRKDIEVTTDDKIVTLSTCTRDSNNNLRYLVVGVLTEIQE